MAQKKPAKKVRKRSAVQKPAKRGASPARRATRQFPAKQGKGPKRADVGYGQPPTEHQFPPGVSGNPAGTPPARANLWRLLCRFLEMPEKKVQQIAKDRTLPVNQRTAAKQALQLLKKGFVGVGTVVSMRTWDRDEGRPTAHVVLESPDVLTPEECDEIRRIQRERIHHGDTENTEQKG